MGSRKKPIKMRAKVKLMGELPPLKDEKREPECLPCPFCGLSHAYIRSVRESDKFTHFVVCMTYGCGGGVFLRTTKLKAIRAWNRRAK